jgi:hypothetical protein
LIALAIEVRIPLDLAHRSEMISPPFRFEVAHLFRDDLARHSGMMSPG